MTSPSPATQAKVNAAAQRNEQATYRKRRFVASIVAPPRKLRLNFSSSQKKIKKCRQNMFHQSGKIHKNTIFHIYIVKGSLAEKLPIYERHPSKVKSIRVESS